MKQLTIPEEIAKIEKEAKKLGIPFFGICAQANINNSTLQRWRSGASQPLLWKWKNFNTAFAELKKVKSNG